MTSKPRWRVLARKLQVYLCWRNTNVRPQPLGCLALRTGPLNPGDRQSVLYGVLAEIEALGLDLLEVRQLMPKRKSPGQGDNRSP
jgi:hypothetical protein